MAEPAEFVVDSVAFRAATPRRRVRFLVFATYVAVLAVWSVAVAIYAHPVLGALAAAFFVELGVAIVRVAGSSGDAVIDPVIDPVAATRIAEPLKELCAKAGCILPLVLIRNDQMRAAAVVERGSRPLLILSAPFVESVNHRQLRALLAHEVVHLAHSDTGRLRRRGRILMLTSVLAGGVTAAALQAGSALPIVIAGMVLGARLVSIPLALAQRRLERRADREGAGLCEDPRALAEALAAAADMSQQTRARLFGPPIVRSLLWPVVGRLPTHPPMAERRERSWSCQGNTYRRNCRRRGSGERQALSGPAEASMPVHEIRMSLPRASVINSDVEIEVWSDSAKLGELHLSKGTIDWRPAHTAREIKLTWEKFARLMEDCSTY